MLAAVRRSFGRVLPRLVDRLACRRANVALHLLANPDTWKVVGMSVM
jgi:hypothetical protein